MSVPDQLTVAEVPPVPGQTIYMKIDLNITPAGKGKKQPKAMTGVFLPSSFALGGELKILLFLHGHFTDGLHPINEYWSTFHSPKYQLRQTLNDSAQSFLLVAPSLSEESEAGDLTTTGGLKTYLDQVLEGVKKYAAAKVPSLPAVISIFVAAHSGGGRPMLEVAEHLGSSDFDKTVKAFWGLDCLYDRDTPYDFYADPPAGPFRAGHTDPSANPNPTELRWFKWARGRSATKLVMHHQTQEPTTRCLNLKRLAAGDQFAKKDGGWNKILKTDGGTALANVTVVKSTEGGHEEMVRPRLKLQLTGKV